MPFWYEKGKLWIKSVKIWRKWRISHISIRKTQNLKKMKHFCIFLYGNDILKKSDENQLFSHISMRKSYSEENHLFWRISIWKFKFWRKPCIFAYFYTKTTHSEESEAFYNMSIGNISNLKKMMHFGIFLYEYYKIWWKSFVFEYFYMQKWKYEGNDAF